jgi:predicted homoserine dehydrogenase-like protein
MIGLIKEHLEKIQKSGKTICVGLVGVGQMGTDIISQTKMMNGIKVVAAADVEIERVFRAYQIAGYDVNDVEYASNHRMAHVIYNSGKIVAASDYRIVTDLPGIDAIIEATGNPEIGACVALRSLWKGKHVVMVNAEADATVGPILKLYADTKGKIYTLGAGDEPAAIKELVDLVSALGLEIVAVGKGKNNPLDRSATPDRVKEEALQRGLSPYMLTEFIDGTKTMIEMAIVSNATGLIPDIRGMHGPCISTFEIKNVFSLKKDGGILNRLGVVDYIIGDLAPGVFVVATTSHPRIRQCLKLRSMGEGPNYVFIRPFHLASMEVPLSVALAVLYNYPTLSPGKRLVSEVMCVAKCDLLPGMYLDRIGGFTHYGIIDKFDIATSENALPIGLAEGAMVKKKIAKGEIIRYEDVVLPDKNIVKIRKIQDKFMKKEMSEQEAMNELENIAESL